MNCSCILLLKDRMLTSCMCDCAEQYSRSASCVDFSCPMVAVLVPDRKNRFYDLLQSVNGVRDETDFLGGGFHFETGDFDTCVQPVCMHLDNMSRGIRPTLKKARNGYRIRVGQDTTIADLVCALREQDRYDSICLDFGGDDFCC